MSTWRLQRKAKDLTSGKMWSFNRSLPVISIIHHLSNSHHSLALKNSFSNILCLTDTDLYQLTMAYAYWKSGKVGDRAVFDLFFRKNPFHGEFTIFAGLEECIKFLYNFRYTDSDLEYLRRILPPQVEEEFFLFLKTLTVNDVTLYAIPEGTVVFPRWGRNANVPIVLTML